MLESIADSGFFLSSSSKWRQLFPGLWGKVLIWDSVKLSHMKCKRHFYFLFYQDAVTFHLDSLALVVEWCSNRSFWDEQMQKFPFFILTLQLLFHSCLPPLHLNLLKDKVDLDYCRHSNETKRDSPVFIPCAGHYCKFFLLAELFYPHLTVSVQLVLQHSFLRWNILGREVNCCVPSSSLDEKCKHNIQKIKSTPRCSLISPLRCSSDCQQQVADPWIKGPLSHLSFSFSLCTWCKEGSLAEHK